MYYPSLEEIQTLADSGQYRRIPICRELYADRYTPVEVMRRLRGASRHCFMLESASQTEVWGRYTFLGYQPTMEITCTDGQMKIRKTGPDGQTQQDGFTVTHPGDTLRSILAQYRSPILLIFPISFLPRSTSILCSARSFSSASSPRSRSSSSCRVLPRGLVPASGNVLS